MHASYLRGDMSQFGALGTGTHTEAAQNNTWAMALPQRPNTQLGIRDTGNTQKGGHSEGN